MNVLGKVAVKAQKIGKVISKKSPELMIAGGVLCLVAGAVMACVKTPEAVEAIEETKETVEEIKSTTNSKKDIRKAWAKGSFKVAKAYAVPVLIFLFGIGAVIMSHNIQAARYNQLLAAYFTLDQTLKAYRKQVSEEVGEEKEREMFVKAQMEVNEEAADFSGVSYGRWFTKNVNPNWRDCMGKASALAWLINVAEQQLNDILNSRGYVFLNEAYKYLGFEETEAGQQVGWVKNGTNSDGYISIGITDKNDKGETLQEDLFLDFNVDGPILKEIGWKTI